MRALPHEALWSPRQLNNHAGTGIATTVSAAASPCQQKPLLVEDMRSSSVTQSGLAG